MREMLDLKLALRAESKILSLHRKIQVRESKYSGIFYAVQGRIVSFFCVLHSSIPSETQVFDILIQTLR